MYFQLEVSNKNKFTIFQLKTSIKNNLKIAEDHIVQGIVLATTTCHSLLLELESTLLLVLVVTWKYVFQVLVMFLWATHKWLYIHNNAIYVNKNQQSLTFIIHKYGVSPLHGLIAVSLRINQIYIKRYKVKIKPYLHHNHSIG